MNGEKNLESKKISLVIMFAAIAIVLNSHFPGFVIPSFFPGLWFYFWEIPLVVALLLLGLKYSVFIAMINGIFIFATYSGPGFNNPFAHLLSSLTTLLGVFLSQKYFANHHFVKKGTTRSKEIIISTIFSMLLRVVIMVPVVFFVIRLLSDLPIEAIIAFLPLLAVYDAFVVAYTVPIAFFVESKIKNKLL